MRLHVSNLKMDLSSWRTRKYLLVGTNEYINNLYNDNRGRMPVIAPLSESHITYHLSRSRTRLEEDADEEIS